MRKNTWAIFAVAAALSLPLAACKDTKTLQENEKLKAEMKPRKAKHSGKKAASRKHRRS